ncbi:hypothetical protein OIV83_005394 [Microbotryomycetes sp. JL201]|nr:hypothetical protein OIV83_005394 [Microbotryomycetes sp. JL201]
MAPSHKDSNDAKQPRNIGVLSAGGHTGLAVCDLLTSDMFKKDVTSVTALCYGKHGQDDLKEMGCVVLDITNADVDDLTASISGIDTMLVIPPAVSDKVKIVRTATKAMKQSKQVTNVCLLSSAGADYANRDQQPHLREFIDLETAVMQPKSDPETEDTAHSPCIVRAGFYAENLLDYASQVKGEAKLPLPIDEDHKFAPASPDVLLGDVALLLAKIITSKGPHGLSDQVRGQIITLTGPMLVSGPELAEAASQAFNQTLSFESISDKEAKKVLNSVPNDELDSSEKEYLMEYYSLVKQGKTNYVSTLAFEPVTGQPVTGLSEFFSDYEDDLKPKSKKRRTRK